MANKRSKIGAIITLDGESTFRASIQNCKSAINAMSAELANIQTKYDGNADGLEALTEMYNKYAEIQETAAKYSESVSAAHEKSKEKQDAVRKSMNEMLKSYEESNEKLKEMKKSGTASADAIEEQEKAVKAAKEEYEKYATALQKCEARTNYFRKAASEAATAEMKASASMSEYAGYIEEANRSSDKTSESFRNAHKSISSVGDGAKDAASSMDIFKGALAADFVTAGLEKVCDLLKDAAKYSIEVGSKVESGMDEVSAISGVKGIQEQRLKEKAIEVGQSSKLFSTEDATQALKYMSLAGWDTEQMLKSLTGVINLATAAKMDLAKASDIVTDYISAFGLEASEAGKFVDIMTYAMSHSNTDVEQLGEAYKNCAATAADFGYTVESTTAGLMVMANAGKKSGEAGTSLNTIMTRLATNSRGCADELRKYGVEVFDQNGNLNDFGETLEGINEVMSTLSDTERATLGKQIAGQEHFTALNILLKGFSDEAKKAGQSFDDYANGLKKCTGAADEMAYTMSSNLQGDMQELNSSLESLGIAAYDYIDGPLRSTIQGITDGINAITDAIKKEKTELDLFIDAANESTDKVKNSKDAAESTFSAGVLNGERLKHYVDVINNANTNTGLGEYAKFELEQAISFLSEYEPRLQEFQGDVAGLFKLSDTELSSIKQSLSKAAASVELSVVTARRNAYMATITESKQAIKMQDEVLEQIYEKVHEMTENNGGVALMDYGFSREIIEAEDSIKALEKQIEEAKTGIKDLDEANADLYERAGMVVDINGDLVNSVENIAEANQNTKTTVEDMTDAWKDNAEELDEEAAKIKEAIDAFLSGADKVNEMNLGDAMASQISNAAEQLMGFKETFLNSLNVDIFSGGYSFDEAYKDSTDKVLSDMLKSGQETLWIMRDYVEDMEALKKSGLSDSAMEYFAEKGLGAYKEVNALRQAADAGSESFKEFQKLYDEALSYQEGTNRRVSDMINTYAESIMSGIEGGYNTWYEFGIKTTQGLFDAIEDVQKAMDGGSLSELGGNFSEVFSQVNASKYNSSHTKNPIVTVSQSEKDNEPISVDLTANLTLDGKVISRTIESQKIERSRRTGIK